MAGDLDRALQAGPESFRPGGSSCRSCGIREGVPAGLERILSFFGILFMFFDDLEIDG